MVPIVVMRGYFEGAMTGTPHFKNQPLGIMEINGQFSHYMNPETDTLWLGFALGIRCAERLANEPSSPPCRESERGRHNKSMSEPKSIESETPAAVAGAAPCSALPDYGHLMDYVLDLHIITGPNGMCRCGEDGITCSERLRRVSHEIGSALLGAHMIKNHCGQKWTPND